MGITASAILWNMLIPSYKTRYEHYTAGVVIDVDLHGVQKPFSHQSKAFGIVW